MMDQRQQITDVVAVAPVRPRAQEAVQPEPDRAVQAGAVDLLAAQDHLQLAVGQLDRETVEQCGQRPGPAGARQETFEHPRRHRPHLDADAEFRAQQALAEGRAQADVAVVVAQPAAVARAERIPLAGELLDRHRHLQVFGQHAREQVRRHRPAAQLGGEVGQVLKSQATPGLALPRRLPARAGQRHELGQEAVAVVLVRAAAHPVFSPGAVEQRHLAAGEGIVEGARPFVARGMLPGGDALGVVQRQRAVQAEQAHHRRAHPQAHRVRATLALLELQRIDVARREGQRQAVLEADRGLRRDTVAAQPARQQADGLEEFVAPGFGQQLSDHSAITPASGCRCVVHIAGAPCRSAPSAAPAA